MTTSEQRRLIVLNHLESGALVNAEAARLLDLSVRQLQRMKAAYADLGAAALSHGLDDFIERLLQGADSRAFRIDKVPGPAPVKRLPSRPGRR